MNRASIFWKWAVLVLVLCNIGLLSVIWFRPHMPFGQKPEQPRDFVISKLKFSADQVKKYDDLIATHRAAMDRLRKESTDARMALFNNLKGSGQPNFNTDSVAQLIATYQKQIELVTYNHFAAVRAICTEDQKTQFDKIIDDVTKMMNGQRRGGHRGDRQGPPPPDGPPPPRQPGPPENE